MSLRSDFVKENNIYKVTYGTTFKHGGCKEKEKQLKNERD